MLEFGGILKQPTVGDGEDVVRHPCHLRLIAAYQEFEFVGYRRGRATAMRFSKNFVAAPAAMIGTAASGDQRDRTHTVVGAPDFDVTSHVDGFAGGPGLSVNIFNLFAWLGAND